MASNSTAPAVGLPFQPRFRLGHRASLDGLRGVAILLVILHHSPMQAYIPNGSHGVTIFFVLSGFLITALLCSEWDRTGSISLRGFYWRRVLRLLPVVVVYLLAALTATRIFYGYHALLVGLRDSLGVLGYYYNWLVALSSKIRTPLLGHTWSLAIEEQFYLLWPAALVLMLRCRLRWFLLLLAIGILAPALARMHFLRTMPIGKPLDDRIYYGTDTRADALWVGCLLGLVASWGLLPQRLGPRRLLRLAGLAAVGVLAWNVCRLHLPPWYWFGWKYTVVASATAVLIAALLSGVVPLVSRVLELGPLTWIGRISYGLYLWHLPFVILASKMQRRLGPGLLPSMGITLGLLGVGLLAAQMSYVVVERPFLRLKDRTRGPERSATTEGSAFPPEGTISKVPMSNVA